MKQYSFKDFLPLFIIFAAIIAFTSVMVFRADTPDLMYGMRIFMAGFFLVFGVFKIINWKGFVTAYKEYDVLAQQSTTYAYAYPLIEIALGLAYFTAWNLLLTNCVTLAIMLVSAYGVWKKLRQGEEVPCACLGVVFKVPMTYVTLFEDLLMALMALVMIIMI